jgi:hypothetical protein
MKRVHAAVFFILFAVIAATFPFFVSCGGGGGGVDQGPPPPGGSGTGANGAVIFWYPYDTNVAVGAGKAVQETTDGGFIVAGTQANDFSSPGDVFLMKTDSKGAVQWKKRWAVAGGAVANAVQQTSDGGYIVVGETGAQAGSHRVYALKADTSGNPEPGWPKTYGASEGRGFAVLEVTNPDGYMIVGYQYIQQQNENVYVIRTDAAGAVVWENSSYGAGLCGGVAGDFGQALAAAPGGNYMIAGTTGCNSWKGFLMKIDGDGNVIAGWPKVLGTSPASQEAVYSVATATDGFVLAGTIRPVSGQPPVVGLPDALVIKTDLSGNELWRKTCGGADQDEAHSVVLTKDNDNKYVVMGYTQSYGGPVNPNAAWQYQDVLMIKLDGSGNTLWQKVKGNRPMSSDYGDTGFAVSDGGFVVTGSSGGNVLLAKFDENGDTINLGATDLTITITGTMGTINFGNAVDVASAGVTAIKSARDIGATTLDLLVATLKGDPVSSFCTGTGAYAISPLPTLPLSAPSATFTLSFTGCETGPAGDATVLDGSAKFVVTSVSGGNDITTATYTVEMSLTSIGITASSTVETLTNTITGSMIFKRQATNNNLGEVSQSIPAAPALTFTESDGTTTRTRVMGSFIMHDGINAAGMYSYGIAADSATVDSGLGPLMVKVNTPIQGTGPGAAPASGVFQVTAADTSQLTATITNGVAALAVDTNGDGTIDGNISAPWDFLD